MWMDNLTPQFLLFLLTWAGSKDDIPVSVDDSKHETVGNQDGYSDYSEGIPQEKQIYGWPNAKVQTRQDYQAFPDHKLNPEGK